ncbi:hypothetical protein GONAM_13_00010, partial [Gordonia namibiensis NBRC 108229]
GLTARRDPDGLRTTRNPTRPTTLGRGCGLSGWRGRGRTPTTVPGVRRSLAGLREVPQTLRIHALGTALVRVGTASLAVPVSRATPFFGHRRLPSRLCRGTIGLTVAHPAIPEG